MKKFIVTLAFIVVLGIGIYFLPKAIPIRKVECQSQFGPCSKNILEKLEDLKVNNLFDTKKSLSQVLGAEDGVAKYIARYQIPDQITVYVIEKKSYIALSKQGLGKFYLYDKDGNFIEEETSTNLPVLVLEDMEIPGLKLGSRLEFASYILHGLFRLYETKILNVKTSSLEASTHTGITVIFPTEGDPDVLLGSLNLIFSRLNTPSETSKIEIDLRYKNPVIR